ncbi:MAG TPA: [FeFe] hydrogenase H-cluster radical SAM maturase HydG [bacterium]|nr:[FeFe] hydrogenase H-cluster radical SAM maturase HydG [bacterium]
MNDAVQTTIIDEGKIQETLFRTRSLSDDSGHIKEVLAKALELKGLSAEETALLMNVSDPTLERAISDTAKRIKEQIYGKRLVLFAPLYISNLCQNECLYCAFRAKNKAVKRRSLDQEEIAREVVTLVNQGHKRLLVVVGEAYPKEGFSYVTRSIETVYSVKTDKGEIRRVNVNVAPLTLDEFRMLKATGIGTYQLFQETYHRETYQRVHLSGKKRDYDWRISATDRAMTAGIDDVGVGVLFGLYDWRFEILAILQHVAHLEKTFGVGPHTISVPRLEPATGSEMSEHPPFPVSDEDFRKIIAILRISVPYTGIILSTRESPETRRESFALGVSQISAGSRTNPGGYSEDDRDPDSSQFSLGDHRTLDEVIRDVASLGYIPSFCTGCYRLGRTGQDFMDLAKPGDIKYHCDPNALSTFTEYLLDYASEETRQAGEALIEKTLAQMDDKQREISLGLVQQVRAGKRDVFC